MKKLMEGQLSEVMLAQADYLERFPDDRHTFALPGEEPFWIEGREDVLKFAKGLRAMAAERRKLELAELN